MARQNYTNRTGVLDSTNATTIYTVPDEKMAILVGGNIMNASGDTVTIDVDITNASDTDFKLFSDVSFAQGVNSFIFPKPFFMDEKEKIKFTASAADKFEYWLSVAEVDQGVNNKYLNVMTDLDSTNKTTLYTVPADRTALVQSWYFCNYTDSSVGPQNYFFVVNAAGTEFEIDYGSIAADTSTSITLRSRILQEKEALKFTAETADSLNSFLSILEMSKAGGSTA
jgi:hypothetical protein